MARKTLRSFVETLAGHKAQRAVNSALEAWFQEAERANWKNPADVKTAYATASIISAERAVSNIKGNDYWLVTAIDYRRRTVFIKGIGSHADYDQIDVRTVRYGD